MGLSLTCSFQELATRTETSEQQAGGGLCLKGGWGGLGCEREHKNAPFVDGEGRRPFQTFYHVSLAFLFAYNAHPTVSHKVTAECLSSPPGRSKPSLHVRQDYALTGPCDRCLSSD